MTTERPYTRLQKIEAHQIAIQTMLADMSLMGGASPRNPGDQLRLAKEIQEQADKLVNQCRKWRKEMRETTNA